MSVKLPNTARSYCINPALFRGHVMLTEDLWKVFNDLGETKFSVKEFVDRAGLPGIEVSNFLASLCGKGLLNDSTKLVSFSRENKPDSEKEISVNAEVEEVQAENVEISENLKEDETISYTEENVVNEIGDDLDHNEIEVEVDEEHEIKID